MREKSQLKARQKKHRVIGMIDFSIHATDGMRNDSPWRSQYNVHFGSNLYYRWNIYGNLMRGLTIKRSEQTIWQVLTSQYVMNACVVSRIKARTFEHVFVRRHIVVWRVPLCGFLSKTHQRHPQQYLEDHLRKSPHWTLMREDEKCWHQKIRTVWKHATSFLLN